MLLLLLTMLHLRLAQYHAQYGIWSTLKECAQCLPDVLVGRVEILSRWYARCRCAALLIQAKSIQKAFILERLFLVDCNDDDDSRNNVLTTVLNALIAIVAMPCPLTMCQYAFLEQRLPHARRLGACVHNGCQIHQPIHQLRARCTLAY